MTGEHDKMDHNGISRRNVLRTVGAGVGTTAVAKTAAAGDDGDGDDNEYIIGLEPGASTAVAADAASNAKRELDFGEIGKAVSGRFGDAAIQGLENNPNVRYVEKNGTMESLGETVPYGIELTDADVAIGDGHTGDGVSIAILDTGVDPTHETLEENMGTGWAADGAECDTSDDCEPSFFCPSNGVSTCYEDWDDDNDHGSHVAGTAAAAMNNTGVKGVAPDATIHGVKVLDCCGSGSFDDIADGIRWSADQGHDVINMSLGGPESDAVSDAVEYAADQGVVIVAAAGNDGPCTDCVGSPADHPEVIAVSATDESDDLAEFSSQGPEVDIAAPGDAVLSSVPRDDYEEFPGTSMAAPHVAGAAASIIASGITDRDAVREALEDGAEDIGLDDNQQGAGRLNVANSLGDGGSDPDPDVSIEIATESASGVGETTATLNGGLVDLGDNDEVEVSFEYGTIGSGFSSSTASSDFDSTSGFSSDVNGLSEGTDYEYRAVGVGEDGRATGGVQTFTTGGSSSEDDGGWCFITTATARDDATLHSLRRFRDDSMGATPLGRGLVGLYYRISPPVAKTLERHPDSRAFRATRRIIQACASLSDRQAQTDSRVKSASIGTAVTGLYIAGTMVGTTGHVAIRAREMLSRN